MYILCFGNIFSFTFKKSIFWLFCINSSMLKKSNFLFYFVLLLASRSVWLFYNLCCFFLKEIKFFENLAIIKIIGHFLFWFFATFPFTAVQVYDDEIAIKLVGLKKLFSLQKDKRDKKIKIASFLWNFIIIFPTRFQWLFRCLKNSWSQI